MTFFRLYFHIRYAARSILTCKQHKIARSVVLGQLMRLLPSSPRKIEVSTSFSMEMQPHDCVNAKVSLQLSWPDGGNDVECM